MSKDKRNSGPGAKAGTEDRLDRVVAEARAARDQRMAGYREQSLRIHPWVCARCGREFTRENLHELTVHHKDHNHDNNPPDGSNWENLCLYCHDNEHARHIDHVRGAGASFGLTRSIAPATHRPFEALRDLLGKDED
ncbi:MAG: YajD family HNH nuclease [Gammaproteobacteria bacterium]|nr:YajD family HNH nuclease [Gammaproteobacteria bacterium]